MKKFSKKMIADAVDTFGKEDICKFFMERCQEAALDAAKCARGYEMAERNLLFSIATLAVWSPVVLAAVGGDLFDGYALLEAAFERAKETLDNQCELLESHDNGSGSIYGD